jgi:undecaprenyl diphosphate synthase
MGLLRRYMRSEREELIGRGARVEAIGDLDQLEPSAREELDRLIAATASCNRLRVTLALSYGGRAEIVAAARRIARAAVAGELEPAALDEAGFARFLYSPDLPDPDLLVRTSGEMRISNFLLWQIAYAELYVTETLWPDFDRAAFFEAIEDYQSRERRFGKVMA